MVNLDVQLWELGTQRLHQGLSETILVNTLTDVRELKNNNNNARLYLTRINTCVSTQTYLTCRAILGLALRHIGLYLGWL